MKKIFLDTNVLLDVLLERDPFYGPAQVVWSLVEKKKIRGAISAVSATNIFFILSKLSSSERAYQALETLAGIFEIEKVAAQTISKALSLRFEDFEDAVQYCSALQFGAKAIISRDPKGFGRSKIPIMNCSEFLALILPEPSTSGKLR